MEYAPEFLAFSEEIEAWVAEHGVSSLATAIRRAVEDDELKIDLLIERLSV